MRKTKILILGGSHTHSLQTALANRKGDEETAAEFEIHWLLGKKGERKRGDLALSDAFEKASKLHSSDLVALSILGNEHNGFGLLQAEQPFDFVLTPRDVCESSDGVTLVPHSAMRESYERFMERNGSIRRIRQAAPCAVYHLSTPPPKGDNNFLIERTRRYREQLIAEIGISSPKLRLKLWDLEMRVLRVMCESWGVSFVFAPDEARSVEGFLKPEYYANDATHANAAYGELVLRQLERIASKGGASQSAFEHVRSSLQASSG